MKTMTKTNSISITSELTEMLKYTLKRGLESARSEILGKAEEELKPIMLKYFHSQEIESFRVKSVTCPDFTHPVKKDFAFFSPEFVELSDKLIKISKPELIDDFSVEIENALRRAILPYYSAAEVKAFFVTSYDLTNYRSYQDY